MDKNFDWKYTGPVEVINALGLTEWLIVAVGRAFEKNGKVFRIIPIHEYLMES